MNIGVEILHLAHRIPMYPIAAYLSWRMDRLSEREIAREIRVMGNICPYCVLRKVIPAFENLLPYSGALSAADSPLSWRIDEFLKGDCTEAELMLVATQFRIMEPESSLREIVREELEDVYDGFSVEERTGILGFADALDKKLHRPI